MMVPPSRPQPPRELLDEFTIPYSPDHLKLVGIRGYYAAMGATPGNDRMIYDDALFVVSKEAFVSFNANCDPGEFKKGVANLVCGDYMYRLGIHGMNKPVEKRYTALVQAGKVAILRDGAENTEEGYFGINIHRGSRNSVSSEGCQTIHPDQFAAFMALVQLELKRAGQKNIVYILRDNDGRFSA